MPYSPQFLIEFVQGEIDSSTQWHQNDGFTERQIPPPQFPVEQLACPQTPRGVLGIHGDSPEQLVDRRMGCMADPSNLNPEAMDVSEMSKYLNLDDYDVYYDGAS